VFFLWVSVTGIGFFSFWRKLMGGVGLDFTAMKVLPGVIFVYFLLKIMQWWRGEVGCLGGARIALIGHVVTIAAAAAPVKIVVLSAGLAKRRYTGVASVLVAQELPIAVEEEEGWRGNASWWRWDLQGSGCRLVASFVDVVDICVARGGLGGEMELLVDCQQLGQRGG
jgi:hypothetical protein